MRIPALANAIWNSGGANEVVSDAEEESDEASEANLVCFAHEFLIA